MGELLTKGIPGVFWGLFWLGVFFGSGETITGLFFTGQS